MTKFIKASEVIKYTNVCFRKFPEGDIIAIFPEEKEGRNMVMSYQHNGQHSDCHWSLLADLARVAPEEYAPLLEELRNIGYNLRVLNY